MFTPRHHITTLRKAFLYAVAAVPAFALYSCLDDSTIGGSIVEDEVAVVIDSSFVPTFSTIDNPDVPSRTITQLIGTIDAPGYGYLSSDVVTQFMPSVRLDTTGVTSIDSLKLFMQLDATAFTGDSLAPMGLQVFPLKKNLVSPMNSSFDPAGYYNPDEMLGSTIYNTSVIGEPDSIRKLGYRQISVNMPQSLGKHLYDAYINNPANYSNPTVFADNVFKGLYLHNSYGSGRVIRVAKTFLSMYFTRVRALSATKDTTTHEVGVYYAVTPEIISNNNITYRQASELKTAVAQGQNIITAPTGTDVELKFPAREMIAKYRKDIAGGLGVVNALSMTIKASAITNKYNIAPPPHLLLILKSKRKEFFANNEINDNLYSFYAAYNETTQSYTFSTMLDYLNELLKKENISDEDVTFVLTPVSISTETSSTTGATVVTAITPFVSWPTMCRIEPTDTKIRFTYTKQSLRN